MEGKFSDTKKEQISDSRMTSEIFNKHIINRDWYVIKKYFEMTADLSQVESSGIVDGWNELIGYQKLFISNPNLTVYKKVLSFHHLFVKEELSVVYKQILRNSLKLSPPVYVDLTQQLQYYCKNNQLLALHTFNYLCYYGLEYSEIGNLNDCLTCIVEPTIINKDYFIFYYFKGIISAINENFSEAFRCLGISVKSSKLGKYFIKDYFYLSLFNSNIEIINSQLMLIIQKGLFNLIIDILPVDSFLQSKLLKYLPLLCLRNLLIKFERNNKIYLEKVVECLGIKGSKHLYLNILSCFEKGLIRGYLNINKKIIVLSKVSPYLNLIEEIKKDN